MRKLNNDRLSLQKKLEEAYRQKNNFLDTSRMVHALERKVARVDWQLVLAQ
jgi:hypothetical protein